INRIAKGRNYGWPVITYGRDYNDAPIGIGARKDGLEQPVWAWVPSIAPSGMLFYGGTLWPQWRGSLFSGALQGRMVARLTLDANRIISEERLLVGSNERIRDLREGPDGALWLINDSDDGRIMRMIP